jgi:hypothetical protein
LFEKALFDPILKFFICNIFSFFRDIASLPTKYRISGLFDLTALNITSATYNGEEEELLSRIGFHPLYTL